MTAYTYGVYDLFHVGHINLFKRIKENCNKLIVGVHNDLQVMSYKRTPIISYQDRLEMIRCCKYVDEIYENANLITTDNLLNQLKADYVFAGRENEEYIKKYYQVSDNKLILLDRTSHICTSDIINKIIKRQSI
jgi:cytidyltransferase-like protein